MHEEDKLDEALYFYCQMSRGRNDRKCFRFNLSALLSAARSVLQYAKKEAETKTGGQKWYDDCITGSRALCFFRDKRDINIHEEPVSVSQQVSVQLTDTLPLSDSVLVTLRDAQGNIKNQRFSETPRPEQAPCKPPIMEVSYRFDDWSGSEDVFALCKMYLNELKNIIADGKNGGFLT